MTKKAAEPSPPARAHWPRQIRRDGAALALALVASPAAAQIGPPPMSPVPVQPWTGTQIGEQQHWPDGKGKTWRTLPLGNRQGTVLLLRSGWSSPPFSA
jgi:hypothetical protein